MSEAIDVVRRAYEALNARELEAVSELVTPDFVLSTTMETHHGPQGVRTWVAKLDDAFADYHAELVDVQEVGDYVVAAVHQRATGTGSGIEVDHTFTHVWTLRDGRLAELKALTERDDALAYVRELEAARVRN